MEVESGLDFGNRSPVTFTKEDRTLLNIEDLARTLLILAKEMRKFYSLIRESSNEEKDVICKKGDDIGGWGREQVWGRLEWKIGFIAPSAANLQMFQLRTSLAKMNKYGERGSA